MRFNLFIIVQLILVLVIHGKQVTNKVKISIRKDGETLKEFSNESDIRSFLKIWNSKKEVPDIDSISWDYSIRIEKKGQSTLWLYNSNGITKVLTKSHTSFFKLDSIDAFNNLSEIK
jgi:hypothetical protein